MLTRGNASALGIGYMLQHDHLFNWRSIWENVTLGLEMTKQKDEKNLAKVSTLLKKYGLADFQNKKPSQLSGGMRQRAMVAMGISAGAKYPKQYGI